MKNIFSLRFIFSAIGLLTAMIFFSSCTEEAEVPRKAMVNIYYDMYIADQLIESVPELRTQADTMSVYPPIIEKYGYTAEQFLSSEKFYLQDPEKYVVMMKKVKSRLEKRERNLTRERDEALGVESSEEDNEINKSKITEEDAPATGTPTSDNPAVDASSTGASPAKVSPAKNMPTDTFTTKKVPIKKDKVKKLTNKDLEELEKKLKK